MSVRMRTVEQTAEAIRELDPETAISKTALRRLVLEGKIPCVYVGKKRLLNLDMVLRYFQMEDANEEDSEGTPTLTLVSSD